MTCNKLLLTRKDLIHPLTYDTFFKVGFSPLKIDMKKSDAIFDVDFFLKLIKCFDRNSLNLSHR